MDILFAARKRGYKCPTAGPRVIQIVCRTRVKNKTCIIQIVTNKDKNNKQIVSYKLYATRKTVKNMYMYISYIFNTFIICSKDRVKNKLWIIQNVCSKHKSQTI